MLLITFIDNNASTFISKCMKTYYPHIDKGLGMPNQTKYLCQHYLYHQWYYGIALLTIYRKH